MATIWVKEASAACAPRPDAPRSRADVDRPAMRSVDDGIDEQLREVGWHFVPATIAVYGARRDSEPLSMVAMALCTTHLTTHSNRNSSCTTIAETNYLIRETLTAQQHNYTSLHIFDRSAPHQDADLSFKKKMLHLGPQKFLRSQGGIQQLRQPQPFWQACSSSSNPEFQKRQHSSPVIFIIGH